MIRKIDPPNRPWKPKPDPRKGRCRVSFRACVGSLRRRIAALAGERKRAWTVVEIVWAAELHDFPRFLVWSALRTLVDRGALRTGHVLRTHKLAGFHHGRIDPVFWHRRWPTPSHVRLIDAPAGREGDHG